MTYFRGGARLLEHANESLVLVSLDYLSNVIFCTNLHLITI